MTQFRPKYITFDCYGTLTNFQMAEAAQKIYGAQLDAAKMARFIKNFAAYRLDEILGDWKPYNEVLHNAVERTCRKNGVKFQRRVNHGMTHSLYISDPNGYGVEVLYELPREVWGDNIQAGLDYVENLPTEGDEAFIDDTNYPRFEKK